MSKNFEKPLKPAHNAQPQMQQNGDSSTSGAYPSNGSSQFNVPTAPPHNQQPGQQRTQVRYPTGPGVPPSHAASQFNVPTAPPHNQQPGQQRTQARYPTGPGVPPSHAASQSNVPTAPPHNQQPGQQRTQQRYPAGPGVPPSYAASQFNVLPTTPMPGTQAARVNTHIQERVKYYADWLAKQAKYQVLNDNSQEINDYIQEATRVVKVGEKEVAMFAPFRAKLSALQTFTTGQLVALCVIGLLWIIGLLVFPLETLTASIAAIIVMYSFNLILSVSMAIRSFQNSSEEHISDAIVHALKDANWPPYTILCPLYREAQVVPQFVQAMLALDYPPEKLQILFLTEEDDAETRNALRAFSLPPHFKIVVVPDGKPRTKPRACNYGLMQATGPYVVIYDAEDIPDPLQLKKAVLTFANHGTDVVCVQAKLNFYNIRQNLLTRWFTAEYSVWFDVILPGLQLAKFPLPLGGTSNHFRAAALRALGGWDAYNVTEDCDLGLRLKRYRMNTVILDSTTLEEANSQLKNWLRQRSRWIKGYLQTYLVHMRHPLEDFKQGRLYNLLSFQIVIASRTGVIFINPLMWVLLGIYIAFGHSVINVYYLLFPGPFLYLGMFCLIFGNFFYVYLYLLACMKRKQYHLLPWTLLIPCYWLLISVAALYALFELLVKPHYWQKTVHGLHLKGKHASAVAASRVVIPSMVDEPTMPVPMIPRKVSSIGAIPSVTMSLKVIPTLLMPAISPQQKQAQRVARRAKVRDLWFVATIVTACIASIAACWYYFQRHEILLYDDAYSHMRIARGVFDSATPGIAQLGGVWLPLPHILMWPFIWNDYLWHTGLAGSFVSMISYIATAVFLFLSVRRLTKNSSVSFLGTLVFIFNPSILYLQSTPLSELICIWTMTMACYFFLTWSQVGSTKYLILAAASTFLATLARYDGWALLLGLLVLVIVIGLMKRHLWTQIQGNFLLFGVPGGFGIVLWLIWNKLIFGDPLYFQHSDYSSQASQYGFLKSGTLYAYHNAWVSFKTYTLNSMETVGFVLVVVAIFAFFVFFLRRRFSPSMLAALAFVAPFGFYILSLYSGQAIIWVPGAVPANAPIQLFNVRYGSEMVVPVALFLATLVARGCILLRSRLHMICQVLFMIAILTQTLFITSNGIISLQDGLYGLSCAPTHLVNAYLAQHYNGGRILMDVSAGDYSESESGLDFKDVVYDGSGDLWKEALTNPAGTADWIIAARKSTDDQISRHINLDSPAFLAHFTLVVQETNSLTLYHRNGTPLLPTHPIPPGIFTDHKMCLIGTGTKT